MEWQLQEAKNRFSQVVKEACEDGPQVVTVRGQERVVILSAEKYRRLSQHQGDLVEFLETSPWAEVELNLTRSRGTGRNVGL